jgi:MFS family permease
VADGRSLAAANALLGASEQATMLLGPVVGGLLVATIGPGGAFAVNGASFLLAAVGVLPAPVTRAPPGPRSTVLAEVREGLRYAWIRVDLRVVLLVVSVEALTYNGVFAVGLPALARSLVQGPVALGLLYSSWGCGQLTGALSAARTGLPRRWGYLMIGTAAGAGMAFVALGLLRSLGPDMAILATLGFPVAYASDVALPTWIQRSTSTALLGRVNSLVEFPRASLAPVSLLAFGALSRLDLAAAFAACGAAMLITAGVAASSRSARQLVLP